MPPQSSFIPKQPRQTSNNQIVRKVSFPVLSIISYALFIGSLIASGVVFVYETYTSNLLKELVTQLDTEVSDFSTADLHTLVDFNQRIVDSSRILNGHISIVSVLEYLEENSLQTIQYESINLKRESDESLLVTADIKATEFDGVLMQRRLLKEQEAKTLNSFSISEISYTPQSIAEGGEITSKLISFTLELDLPTYQFALANQLNLVSEEIIQLDTPVIDETPAEASEEVSEVIEI